MKFDAVIFDLDGTLLDTLADLADSANRVLERCGFAPHPLNAFRYIVGNRIKSVMSRAVPEGTPDSVTEQLLAQYREEYRKNLVHKTKPYAGVCDLVRALRAQGIRTAVLSNKPDPHTKKLIETFFAPEDFLRVYGERAGIPRKPDATSCRLLMEELGVLPGRTAYVGDSGSDMVTAKNAGVAAIGAEWGFRDRQELLQNGADFIAESPAALAAFCLEN